jgi:hypothetical protein
VRPRCGKRYVGMSAHGRNHRSRYIRDAIDNGEDKHRKHLLQALVAEIRVESREQITPVYRVPHAQQVDTVRAPEASRRTLHCR